MNLDIQLVPISQVNLVVTSLNTWIFNESQVCSGTRSSVRARAHTHEHTQTHAHACRHTCTHTHTHTHARTHARTYTHACTHADPHKYTYTCLSFLHTYLLCVLNTLALLNFKALEGWLLDQSLPHLCIPRKCRCTLKWMLQ